MSIGRIIFLLIFYFGIFCTLILPNQDLYAQDLAEKEKALNDIANFADRICNNLPLTGSGEDLELSGDAKAELNGLINKLVSLGIHGAVKYKKTNYENVLQKDLATSLKDSANCKLEVFRELKSKMLAP